MSRACWADLDEEAVIELEKGNAYATAIMDSTCASTLKVQFFDRLDDLSWWNRVF